VSELRVGEAMAVPQLLEEAVLPAQADLRLNGRNTLVKRQRQMKFLAQIIEAPFQPVKPAAQALIQFVNPRIQGVQADVDRLEFSFNRSQLRRHNILKDFPNIHPLLLRWPQVYHTAQRLSSGFAKTPVCAQATTGPSVALDTWSPALSTVSAPSRFQPLASQSDILNGNVGACLRRACLSRVRDDRQGCGRQIGTASPGAKLHVSGTQAGDGAAIRLTNTTATVGKTYKVIGKDDGTAEIIAVGSPDKVVARMGVK